MLSHQRVWTCAEQSYPHGNSTYVTTLGTMAWLELLWHWCLDITVYILLCDAKTHAKYEQHIARAFISQQA